MAFFSPCFSNNLFAPKPLARPAKMKSFAVGTALTGGPPHRSQRALLTHWAPASGTGVEAHVREGMLHTGGWEPPGNETFHPLPVHSGSLASAPERVEPVPYDLG